VTIPAVNTYRILWVDSAGEGRFTDLQHISEGAAAWAVAMDAASGSGLSARFVGMVQLADPAQVDPGPAPAAPSHDQAPEVDHLPDPGPTPEAATPPPFPYGGPPAT
jgi:hypothetical protein